MDKEDALALNRRIAEWLGFVDNGFGLFKKYTEPELITLIQRPQLGSLTKELNFTGRFDACLKWVLPRLQRGGYYVTIEITPTNGSHVTIYNRADKRPQYTAFTEDSNLALAFCIATDKLIGSKQ